MQYAIVAAFAAVAVALPADEWSVVPTTTTTSKWEEIPKTTSKAEWNTWETMPKPDKKTCTTIYVTKDCGDKKDDWNACKDVTKTDILYDDKCTWAGWDQPPKETWAPAPYPTSSTWAEVPKKETETWSEYSTKKVCTYVTIYDNVYTTKECGDKKDAWDNCKDVTKTEKKTDTKTDDKCTGTWGEWYTWGSSEKPKETTWAPAPVADKPKETSWSEVSSVKAAETWAPASVAKPAASSTVWSPVAKFTGAADKQTVGFGAAAIAAIAMML